LAKTEIDRFSAKAFCQEEAQGLCGMHFINSTKEKQMAKKKAGKKKKATKKKKK